MLFYAPLFLFLFLPATLFLVFSARGRWRDYAILASSAFFYFWGEPKFVFVVFLSALLDYLICGQVRRWRGSLKAFRYLVVGVGLNILLLVYFKYLDFFIDSVNQLFVNFGQDAIAPLNILLPLGVSFIVFEKITYLVDVYRGHGEPAPDFTSYLLYVMFFPKLLAGPIVKYHDFAPQFANHRQTLDGFLAGFQRFLLGLVKKVLLADTVGEVANHVFALPASEMGFGLAWLGVICFTLQIYLDFSAYSDMAIGLARMLGFRLLENFNMPYISASFTEFWRRWHISLSSWIREYLYFSLGGNRLGALRTYANLWVCFLLSGLWHGASWTFVLWGAYHGFFLILDKWFWLDISKRLPRPISVAITLSLVMVGWILFRAASMEQAVGILSNMLHPGREGAFFYITANIWMAMGVGIAMALLPAFGSIERGLASWRAMPISRSIELWGLGLLSFFALGKAVTVTFNPFLYFRF